MCFVCNFAEKEFDMRTRRQFDNVINVSQGNGVLLHLLIQRQHSFRTRAQKIKLTQVNDLYSITIYHEALFQ